MTEEGFEKSMARHAGKSLFGDGRDAVEATGKSAPSSDEKDATKERATANDDIIGRAWNATLILLCLAALGVCAWIVFRLRRDSAEPPVARTTRFSQPAQVPRTEIHFPDLRFTEIGVSAGLTYQHENGATGELLMPENYTGGCAFFDYDNDGDSDVLFVNARGLSPQPARTSGAGERPAPRAALYRNDGSKFTDITDESGLGVSMFGMGIAAGDYDGDGWRDVFLTGVGKHYLLRNQGGRFVDVTVQAGVPLANDQWSTSCGFLDYDRDGDLDLFVCNYVSWSRDLDLALDHRFVGEPTYLPPALFKGGFCILYRNQGDGTFSDVSEAAGIRVVNPLSGLPAAKALGCVFCDVDEDGWMDIVVANDLVPSFLFRNQKDGTFKEVGVAGGLAFGHNGTAVSGMGVDVMRTEQEVLIGMANIARDPTAMFRSQSDRLTYLDETRRLGVYADSLMVTKWGLFFFDYDLDGRLDMFQSNGSTNTETWSQIEGISYRQPLQLFWNTGGDQGPVYAYVPPDRMTADGPLPDLQARGAAFADIDGDGDLDVLVAQLYGPPVLLRNDQKLGHHWLRFRLTGKGVNRDAIGAWIEVTSRGKRQSQQVMPTRSYLSQVEREVTFGLGPTGTVEKVQVTWPDGSQQIVSDYQLDCLNIVVQR